VVLALLREGGVHHHLVLLVALLRALCVTGPLLVLLMHYMAPGLVARTLLFPLLLFLPPIFLVPEDVCISKGEDDQGKEERRGELHRGLESLPT